MNQQPDPAPRRRSSWLLRAALRAEDVYDAFHRFLARITGHLGRPMVAEIYFAVRHSKGISVRGRVLLARTWPHPHPDDPGAVNLWQMLRRWFTPERPYSLVRISAGDSKVEQRANREGYFLIELPAPETPIDTLLVEMPESSVSPPVTIPITTPTESPSHLIISDVDDTILLTHAGRVLSMIATTMLGNALTRQIFPGVPELFQILFCPNPAELQRQNPIAYVTSSPYNLHNLLTLTFETNGLPPGPFFMTDWGLDEDKWITRSHRDHKNESIQTLLDWYPGIPALLLGDTTLSDVPIYVDLAKKYPERIALILIHAVSSEKRLKHLRTEAKKLDVTGIPIHFFRDYAEAADILAEAGWISLSDSEHVRSVCQIDE